MIEENINIIADNFVSYNHKTDVVESDLNDLAEDNSIIYNDKLIEIKKGTVFGILAETINEIYKEDNKLNYMTTSTGQRYIYTAVKDASHPNGKLFGNKKELPLPLVIEGENIYINKSNIKKTVYVETNFSKSYAEHLSEFMKRKAVIK